MSSSTPDAPERLPTLSDRSVFLNCPYDADFRPRFDALIFTVVACGFTPRSALESRNVATTRISRILEATFTSDFSIHDLSRCRGEGDANLARFNMPLELGMAMAKRHADELSGRASPERHHWLALAPSDARYDLYVSDLSGYDLERYDGTIEEIVAAATSWLADRSPERAPVSTRGVLTALPKFQDSLTQLRADWRGREPWREVVLCARKISGALV